MKTLNIIALAGLLLGIFIISTNLVVLSHTIDFSQRWLIPIFVYLCKLLINKLWEYVQVHISNKLSNLIVLSPKLFNFCYRLSCKLNENWKIIIYYLSYNYPSFFWALKRYNFIYSDLSNKYPIILWLKEVYCASSLIVICSYNLDLYISFSAFTISFLMIIYIRYIDPSFSRRHPVLYWIILVVSLLIFFYSILSLPYIVYARASRKKAESRPTDHKSKQNPGGPPHNKNTDPYMQQSSNDKKKSTSKKTTNKKATLTEDQKKENKRLANARYREKVKNDTTVDENGLTALDKTRAKGRVRQRRYKKTDKGKVQQAYEILSRPSRIKKQNSRNQ